jgi:hypothetical protein
MSVGGAPTPAHALTFSFSFANTANGGGTVQGLIYGLSDNATSSATQIQITSNTDGFGVGQYAGTFAFNTFTVSSGSITGAQVEYFGAGNSSPDVTCCSLYMYYNTSVINGFGLTDAADSVTNNFDASDIFTLAPETPIPSALPLFATGLGALGLLGWRRKRKAQAAA